MRSCFLCFASLVISSSPVFAGFITNGDFSQGNTGFTTGYTYSPGDIGPALTYDIVTDPANSRPNDVNPISYGDHTTGTGLMMAVNGANFPNSLVWSQTVSVTPSTDYEFSVWMSSWFAAVPANFDIQFNGSSIGTPSAPSTTAVWQEFKTTWNSGTNSSAVIDIRMTNSADIGGDFALDDINLTIPSTSAVPEPSSFFLGLTSLGLVGSIWVWRKRSSEPVQSN